MAAKWMINPTTKKWQILGSKHWQMGQLSDPCCCKKCVIHCGDILGASVRFTGVNLGCCIDNGSGLYKSYSGAINGIDIPMTSGFSTGGGFCGASTVLSQSLLKIKIYTSPVCTGSEWSAPESVAVFIFYDIAVQTWKLGVVNPSLGKRDTAFYGEVYAPATAGCTIPLPAPFTNLLTACNQSVPYIGTPTADGPSGGFNGSAVVTWTT